MRSKDAVLDVIIIAGRLDLLKEYKKFRKIMKDGFLESEDVMEIAGIEPGPVVGKIILALRRAEFQGVVKSEKEAVDFVRSYQK